MPRYKVKANGFIGGIYRTPGGKHDPVVTAAPLKKVPSWLELIKEEKPKAAPKRGKKNAAKEESQETENNETPEDFMGNQGADKDAGLETI